MVGGCFVGAFAFAGEAHHGYNTDRILDSRAFCRGDCVVLLARSRVQAGARASAEGF